MVAGMSGWSGQTLQMALAGRTDVAVWRSRAGGGGKSQGQGQSDHCQKLVHGATAVGTP